MGCALRKRWSAPAKGGRAQNVVTSKAFRTNSGSMVIPKPGPEGTRTIPFSTLNVDVALDTGMVALPLNSVNGTGFGMQETKWAASR